MAEYHANDTLDTTFGSSGIVLTSLGMGAEGFAVDTLSNGTIVVGGYELDSSGNPHGVLLEYTANGTPLTSFGSSGVVTGAAGTEWKSLSVLSNGDFLIGGASTLYEYDSGGTPVSTFGTSGVASLGSLFGYTFTVLSSGQILVGGWTSSYTMAAEEFSVNGVLNTSFGSSGVAATTVGSGGSEGQAYVISVLANGEILLGGTVYDGDQTFYLALAELHPNGTQDTTFGARGGDARGTEPAH